MNDLADQLTNAVEKDTVTQGTLHTYSYGYDANGNRTSDALGTHTFNNVNQTQDSGYTYDAAGRLTCDGTYTYTWDAANRLRMIVSVFPEEGGGSGDGDIEGGMSESPPSHGGGGGIPGWQTTYYRTDFTYDGLGRRIRIEERRMSTDIPGQLTAWALVNDHRYVWGGNTMIEERQTSDNSVTKRYFAEGMQRLGAVFVNGQWVTQMIPYYFTRDHLGSVREVTNATGTLSTRYDYDPFGKPTWLITGTDSDFGFTGHFRHRVSGLYLPLYRAYDPIHGRWISRDPIGEDGGLNLYGYVANNPLNTVDPLGLESEARFYIYCKCRCEDEWRLVRVEVVPGLGGAVTYGPATIHVNPTDAADAVRQQANNPYTRQNPATVPNSSGGIQTLAHECGHTCQAKVLGPLYLPAAGLNSLLEILTGGYRNGLNNLKTPTERGASNTGMFGGFAPAPVSP